MKLATQIRPISYLKAHASEIVRNLAQHGPAMVITQNGEAKAVLQDVHSYEQTQETLALLKVLALGQQELAEGKTVPLAEGIARIKARRRPAGG
ncbi:MAG: type II toxin-antitoxin system Phd/YefM family antitoxin [Gammaproteobacteria bacterium]|nr:type II toxin-antitoxin system Phd/YefM family antitoxin [Gammaproteobacteria bacterium]